MIAAIIIGALVFCAAATGGFFKPGPWYRAMNRPAWTPPDWLFPVVWTPLYLMIGYAGWLAWQAENIPAVALWGAQLLANGAWSWLFFGRRQMRVAFVDLGLLWLLIWSFVAVTSQALPTAALMFVPYGIWVSIAGMLNLRMIQLNPASRA